MNHVLFISGATGFIGHETVVEGVKAGWQVKGLVHSEKNADALRKIGATPVVGDVHQPQDWIAEARGATAFIDLVQPKFPKRLSRKAIKGISTQRQAMTRSMLDALGNSLTGKNKGGGTHLPCRGRGEYHPTYAAGRDR